MIDAESGVPVHLQVQRSLRDRVAAGEWHAGAFLPSEPDLAHEYAVGRDTVRKALAALDADGVIIRQHARRAQVPQRHDRQSVSIPRGSTMDPRMPDADERRRWGLPRNVPVLDVTYGGRTTTYPSDRYTFTSS